MFLLAKKVFMSLKNLVFNFLIVDLIGLDKWRNEMLERVLKRLYQGLILRKFERAVDKAWFALKNG
jgi:hypothetical protein